MANAQNCWLEHQISQIFRRRGLSKSLNTQPNDKRPLLVKEAIRLDLDIVCLFESRLLGQNNVEINGYVLVWSGQTDKYQAGVAILMKKKIAQCIQDIQYVSERVKKIVLSLHDQSITIISAYAPTNTSEIAKKNSFYDELDKATTTIPSDHKVFVCADFNARIG